MPLFGSRKVSSFTLSIALKSSSVDVQLVSISPEGKREVLLAERKIIFLTNSQDPEAYTNQCLSELSALLRSSQKEICLLTKGVINETRIVLYAPWFTSKITSINHKDDIVITEKFLADQIRSIKPQKSLITLEKRVIKILTNGYSLSELTRSKVSNICIDVYSSYVSDSIYKKITQTIMELIPYAPRKNFTCTTSPIMIFEHIKSLLVSEDNMTFLYVGGEITEVGVIEDDSLSFFGTFPLGKHDFLREIQGRTNSYDYDLLYQKQIDLKSATKQASLDKLKGQWAQSVIDTLLSYKKNVPSKLMIISDSRTSDFFTRELVNRLKADPEGILAQHRIINFDISSLKDIISYKTAIHAQELDLHLEALIKN